jgi:glycosyltransferase involved in cell wall biosynthesis
MNVLHLVSGRGPTGPAAAAMSDAKSLLAAGHKAFIASRAGAMVDACQAENIPFIGGFKLGRGAMRLLHLPHDVRHLRSVIREYAIDIVHVHRSDDQLMSAASLGRTVTAMLVRTWHRDPDHIPRPLLSKLARQANGSVCVSRAHAITMVESGSKHTEFIHVAADTDVFTPDIEKQSSTGGPVRIAHIGRWKRDRDGRDRGQCAALDVFQKLSPKLPWKGFIVGRGEMAETLKHEAYEERKLSKERVELVHFEKQSPGDFAKLLSTFDIGLIFTPGSDGTSRAGAELLACGVPLIVADVPGLRELAEDGGCALRQLSNDASGWAHAIEKLMADPQTIPAMRRAARQRAENAHSLIARGRALAAFYENL